MNRQGVVRCVVIEVVVRGREDRIDVEPSCTDLSC